MDRKNTKPNFSFDKSLMMDVSELLPPFLVVTVGLCFAHREARVQLHTSTSIHIKIYDTK